MHTIKLIVPNGTAALEKQLVEYPKKLNITQQFHS
jgi:hypothetical protein